MGVDCSRNVDGGEQKQVLHAVPWVIPWINLAAQRFRLLKSTQFFWNVNPWACKEGANASGKYCPGRYQRLNSVRNRRTSRLWEFWRTKLLSSIEWAQMDTCARKCGTIAVTPLKPCVRVVSEGVDRAELRLDYESGPKAWMNWTYFPLATAIRRYDKTDSKPTCFAIRA